MIAFTCIVWSYLIWLFFLIMSSKDFSLELFSEKLISFFSCLSGGCKWIRTPAIVYSAHVATTLVPILGHILFYQFPVGPHPGPQTLQERMLLVSIYAPYLLVPLLLLFTMLLSSTYNSPSKSGNTSAKKKKKWFITRLHLIFSDFRR